MCFCLPSLEMRAIELLTFKYKTTLKSVGGSFMPLRPVGLSIVSRSFMESPTLMGAPSPKDLGVPLYCVHDVQVRPFVAAENPLTFDCHSPCRFLVSAENPFQGISQKILEVSSDIRIISIPLVALTSGFSNNRMRSG